MTKDNELINDDEPDRIEPLFAYLNNMTVEEIDERIKQIRAERRSYKKKPSKVKKDSVKASTKAKKLLAGLSEAEIASLLKELEE